MISIAIKHIFSFFFLLCVLCIGNNSYCSGQNPEQFIKEFYLWYFEKNKKSDPIQDTAIYQYISNEFKDRANLQQTQLDINYFTKLGWTSRLRENREITVKQKTEIGEHIILIVEFNSSKSKEVQHIVVFLKKFDHGLRIVKVSDIYPEPYADSSER